jgi:hypothetical protein
MVSMAYYAMGWPLAMGYSPHMQWRQLDEDRQGILVISLLGFGAARTTGSESSF